MMSIRPGVLLLIITIIISGIVQIPAIQAQKTDVIIMNNGDRITGEVKKLEYGLVTGVVPYDENRHLLLRPAGNLKQITKVHFGFRSEVHFLVSAKKSIKQAPRPYCCTISRLEGPVLPIRIFNYKDLTT